MSHNKRLSYCNVCEHKAMNMRSGIVCGLTNERANFEETCDNYKENEIELAQFLVMNAPKIAALKKLKQQNKTVITWIGTKTIFFLVLILPLLFLVMTTIGLLDMENKLKLVLIGSLMLLITSALALFIGTYAETTVNYNDEKVTFDRILGGKASFQFDEIYDVQSFPLGRTKYIKCTIQLENKDRKEFIMVNSRFPLLSRQFDSQSYLSAIKDNSVLYRFL